MYGEICDEIKLESWKHTLDYYYDSDLTNTNWVFRGQSNSAWPLSTTFERNLVKRLDLHPNDLRDVEKLIIRQFQRQAGNYFSTPLPPFSHQFQWMSLMQHYGVARSGFYKVSEIPRF